MYRQKQSPYYDPFVTKIPTDSFELVVNYMERHDETTAEFPHTHTSCEIYYTLEGEVHPVSYTHLDVYKRQDYRRFGSLG